MEILFQDLRYGFRTLRKTPGFAIVAIGSLALGVGANTAIFSIVDALMLRQLPVRDPGSLVLFGEGRAFGATDDIQEEVDLVSEPAFAAIRQQKDVFEDACGLLSMPLSLRPLIDGANRSEPLKTRLVTGNYFSLLGVNAAAGRLFTNRDDDPRGAHPEMVLGYVYWQRRFGSKADAIGSTMRIGKTVFTVIGVAAPEFFGTTVGEAPNAWLPLSMEDAVPLYLGWHKEMDQDLHVIARLKPGVSIQTATAAESVLLKRLVRGYVGGSPSPNESRRLARMRVRLTLAATGLSALRDSFAFSLRVLMVLLAIVLLIACANVANLLLARATARNREMAVRMAVGSNRLRIVRQMLTESLLLSITGGMVGVLFAVWATQLLLKMVSRGPDPVILNVNPNFHVLLFTFAVALVTGILFGVAPAFRALVVSQVTLSLMLLIAATLFVRSFRNLESIETGFNRENLLLFSLDVSTSGLHEDASLPPLYQSIERRVSEIPNVRSASFSMFAFQQGAWTSLVAAEGHPEVAAKEREANLNVTGPGYLNATGIGLLRGRYSGAHDTAVSPKVAVLNEKAAREIFGNESALGKHIGLGQEPRKLDVEVVGVARVAKYAGLREETPWAVYVPYTQISSFLGDLLVRVRGNPDPVISRVRQVVSEIDGNVPIAEVTTMSEVVDRSIHTQQLIAQLSAFFGGLALLLAAIGLYGILSYSVARRTNEIGIRMALGARNTRVLWMILRETLVLIGLGTLTGIPASLFLSRYIRSMLYGLKSSDWFTLALSITVLAGFGMVAGFLPARRAAWVDPMVALRYE